MPTSSGLDAATRDRAEHSTRMAAGSDGLLIQRFGPWSRPPFYCQGDYDAVIIFEVPDAEAADAIALAAVGAGHLTTYKTTPLCTVEEIMRAMRKAAQLAIRPPSG